MTDAERLEIEKTLAARVERVATGNVADWADYRNQVGYISALRTVLGITADLVKENGKMKGGPERPPPGIHWGGEM